MFGYNLLKCNKHLLNVSVCLVVLYSVPSLPCILINTILDYQKVIKHVVRPDGLVGAAFQYVWSEGRSNIVAVSQLYPTLIQWTLRPYHDVALHDRPTPYINNPNQYLYEWLWICNEKRTYQSIKIRLLVLAAKLVAIL